MKKILAFLLLFNTLAFCDNNSTEEMNFVIQSIRQNISINKFYPALAKEKKIAGEVFLEFAVDKNGKLKNVHTKYNQKILQKAALTTLKKSFPVYIPIGIQNQFPITFRVTLRYALDNDKILIP